MSNQTFISGYPLSPVVNKIPCVFGLNEKSPLEKEAFGVIPLGSFVIRLGYLNHSQKACFYWVFNLALQLLVTE
jgi:hypothetical protein